MMNPVHSLHCRSRRASRFRAGESATVHCELRSNSMFAICIFTCFEAGDRFSWWEAGGGDGTGYTPRSWSVECTLAVSLSCPVVSR